MGKFETWLTGLMWVGLAFLLPMAALAPMSEAGIYAAKSVGGLAASACDDGSAHLVMGCASILL